MTRQSRQPRGAPQSSDGWDAERLVTLSNRYGLHMRPSKQVVELANSFPCDIILSASGQEVDAKSILGLIGLGAECGVEVAVKARGDRAAEAVAQIAGLLGSLPELHGEPRDGGGARPSDTAAEGAPRAAGPRRSERRLRRGKGGGRS